MATEVQISQIIRKAELQSRAKLDAPTVARYAAAMQEGAKFKAITLYRLDGDWEGALMLVDGWHRVAAAEQADKKAISAEVIDGTWDQAVTAAAIAEENRQFDTVGLPRTNADKHRQTEMFLSIAANRKKSDNSISKLLHVSPGLVATVRQERIDADDPDQVRVDASGREMHTGKIGKNPSKEHAAKRKKDAILNKVEPEVAQTAMQLAETHAAITGEEVTPSMLESAVEVAQEVANTGFVDVGGQQLPPTEHTTVRALQINLDEKEQRHISHMNGDRALPLQTVTGQVVKGGHGKMLLEFAPELEEKLLEFERYREQYPGHVVHVSIYMEEPIKPIHRPSRPVAQPDIKLDWERIADGEDIEPETVIENAQEAESAAIVSVAEPEKPKAKRTRKPKAAKPDTDGDNEPVNIVWRPTLPAWVDTNVPAEPATEPSEPDSPELDIF